MTTYDSDQSLPSPDLPDLANGPGDFAALIAVLVKRLAKSYASIADRTARNPNPTESELGYLQDLDRWEFYTGSAWTELVPKQPGCVARLASAQSIPDNANTLVTMDTEEFDNGAFFTAPSTTLTIPSAGVYNLQATGAFAANATGIRIVEIHVNGTIRAGASANSIGAGTPTALSAGCSRLCAQGDTVTMRVYQNSGAPLNLEGAGWFPARLSAVRSTAS